MAPLPEDTFQQYVEWCLVLRETLVCRVLLSTGSPSRGTSSTALHSPDIHNIDSVRVLRRPAQGFIYTKYLLRLSSVTKDLTLSDYWTPTLSPMLGWGRGVGVGWEGLNLEALDLYPKKSEKAFISLINKNCIAWHWWNQSYPRLHFNLNFKIKYLYPEKTSVKTQLLCTGPTAHH